MNLLVFFNFWILYLFFVNGQEAQHVNPDWLKCISGINLSTTNKDLFTISFILSLVLTCLIQNRIY